MRRPRRSHACSIGERSGERAGQGRVGTPRSSKHSMLFMLMLFQEQSLRDEVWRCPVGKSGFEPERSEQREAAKLHRDTSARHHAIDNTQRTSSTVPDCIPYHDIASFVTVMLQAAGSKSLASKSMNVDSAIVEVECKPRFVAPHYSTPFIQPFPRLISAPSLSQILVPWSQWDPHCWAVRSYIPASPKRR